MSSCGAAFKAGLRHGLDELAVQGYVLPLFTILLMCPSCMLSLFDFGKDCMKIRFTLIAEFFRAAVTLVLA